MKLGPVFKAFLVCVCIGIAGVGYVWQKNELLELGKSLKKREQKLAELERENHVRHQRLTYWRSPIYLEQRIQALKLGLKAPHPSQVVTLPDAGLQPAPGEGDMQIVRKRDGF